MHRLDQRVCQEGPVRVSAGGPMLAWAHRGSSRLGRVAGHYSSLDRGFFDVCGPCFILSLHLQELITFAF